MIFLKKKKKTKKKTEIFSSNILKRWSFQKGLHLSQEIRGNMIFSVYTYGCCKHGATPLCQKKSKMILSRKNSPKGD